MGTNLDLLAVSSQATNQVFFVDIDPSSATFHQVVRVTAVGMAPRGIAWDPGNEDILVCNEGDDSVSILSTSSLSVRKVVHRGLDRPFAVAITQRQQGFGFQRNVYFAYILDRAGRVSLFESGPSGVNGWGYDEIIGRTPFAFAHPRAMQPDPLRLESGVWIAHEDQLDAGGHPTGLAGGAVSNLVLDCATLGQLPLNPVNVPNMRGLSFRIARSIGSDQLSGDPVDIAFDDQRNLGALANLATPFSGGTPAPLNGKSLVRRVPVPGDFRNTNEATYLFVPIRGSGVVDVLSLRTGLRVDTSAYHAGVQSISAPGAALVMDYFRE
jgi:YVTN family beta-propeller protein